MSFESIDVDWSLDYCLACDKQTNGGVYCSEACRLADYENANSGSEASSPTTPRGAGSWPMTKLSNSFLFLQPAFDYAAFKPYGSTPHPKPSNTFLQRPQSSPVQLSKPILTPSSSQSSLFSMQSTSSTQSATEQSQLSEEARKELRAYANCFDQSRYNRRQSTH